MSKSIFSTTAVAVMLVAFGAVQATSVWAHENQDPIGDAVEELPIFDAHIHYKEPAWGPYPVQSIIELMDRNGVAMGLVSSTPDEGTIMLWEYAPNRVVPELRPYHGNSGSSNWTELPEMASYLEGRLESYPHEGIGEFHIRSRGMWDEALFRTVIQMAKERDIYLHVHSGTEPIRWLYDLDPDVKIIWAHAGLGEPANAVYELMSEYPDLLADTSLREYAILGSGNDLNPEWKKIVMEFQDRLMVGSDTWVNSQWDDYDGIIASNRRWLSKLPRDVAEKIAYKNAERVFGRDFSNSLIGKR
ncbi:MAG: amidohydrolase family protein [Ruegeria sp.]